MKVHFLGDVHGCWSVIQQALLRCPDNLLFQVGDMGLGFPETYTFMDLNTGKMRTKANPADPIEFPERFRFIRGNHDNPAVCRKHPNYLGDYGVHQETGIFFLSGAMSTDADHRTEDLDWWRDEQLDLGELHKAIDAYDAARPETLICHEPPLEAHRLILRRPEDRGSRTCQALQAMLDIHRPRLCVFGHHHKVWRKQMGKTLFACAATNQILNFDI